MASLLSRFTAKLFGSTANANRIAEFGSLANGSPLAYSGATATPSETQALSNWEEGLDGSLVAGSATPIQDLNAVLFTNSYFISYILQQGLGAWDSGTLYGSNALCMGSTGIVYQCTTASSQGDAPPGSSWTVFQVPLKYPTVTRLFSGSGTYVTPAGCTYLKVTMVGGGGGGQGGNGGANGSPGSATTFGGTTLVAFGGAGGVSGSAAGGSPSVGAGPITLIAVNGTDGQYSSNGNTNYTAISPSGGNSPFGGAGNGVNNDSIGGSAQPNSGSGGGGGGPAPGANSGGSGASGGYLVAIITNPASSYAYVVGAGGAGGGGGVSAGAGGAGAAGCILIEEHYGA